MMSLVPARYNFTIYQGATFYKKITFEVEGSIQDLSEYDAELVIKDEPGGSELLTLAVGEGITLGGVLGTIDLKIEPLVTKNLTWSAATYELLLTDPIGRIDVLMRGGFKVVPF